MNEQICDQSATVQCACRRAVGRIGLAVALSFCLSQGATLCLGLWLQGFAPAALQNDWVSLGVSVLPIYLLAIPLVWLMVGRLPAAYPLETRRLGFGTTLAFAAAVYALAYGAQVVTLGLLDGLGRLAGREFVNALDEVIGTSSAATFLVVGLLGPLMEEFLFRVVLLRRLLPYGRTFAVVTSALLFGLYHGNFFQMGYAFAIGLALGYITVRTGSVLHAACMHIFVNSYSNLMAFVLERYPAAGTVMALVPMGLALAGVVVLAAKHRTIAYHLRPAPLPPTKTLPLLLKSPAMWLCAMVCCGAAVYLLAVW